MLNLRRVFASAAVAAATFGATSLEAQSCLGYAPFSSGNTRVGGVATFSDNATGLQGDLVFGGLAGPFGGFSAGFTTFEGGGGNALNVGANLGTQISLGTTGAAGICPVVDGDAQFGPNGGGLETNTQRLGAGLGFGVSLPLGTTASLVPFGVARFNYGRLNQEQGALTIDVNDTYASFDLGAGLVFDNWLTLRPSITIPTDSRVSSGDNQIYRLGVHFTVGGGR